MTILQSQINDAPRQLCIDLPPESELIDRYGLDDPHINRYRGASYAPDVI
ncbi:hypothetical protein Thiowin_01019 [Thiorhodovibrio winogradskyi]|uniref:Uncharacterized protein n=1 Tax=Thiorhodovibrio winogradskyi TaxID=77007 RepID=A0ABZ0S514_9GAMM